MTRTVTLLVSVKCGRDTEVSSVHIPIFEITEGDHVWNTLVGDRERDGVISLAPCIPYLRSCAEDFSGEHPELLEFGSPKKASRFSSEVLRRPLNLRGSPYPVPYPGSAS